jgi:light-regulated signal transduction histidine kinase (bacteriophytochrome)
VRKDDKTPDYFIAIIEDIGARKQAEEEIRRLNAGLEQRVEQRTAELIAMNKELDTFAYAVSHDLRAPLRALNGFSQALLEDYGERLAGDAKDYLDQIVIASRKMGELIDGLLALSRSTRGELRRDAIDVSALAARVLAELEKSYPERAVTVDIEAGLTIDGDAQMIEAVMRNLIGNAWKYTSKTAAPAIRVYSSQIGGRRAICVADNGAGFDMAYAGQLFQPFRRLHRQDEFPGIGIGLATVQRIVRRHGGEIHADATLGAGATFCFCVADGSEAAP